MTASAPTTAQRSAATAPAAACGAFAPIDLHLAEALTRRTDATDPVLGLAIALVAKAVRLEHVCVMLDEAGIALLWRDADGAALSDPPPAASLLAALSTSPRGVEVTPEGAPIDEAGGDPLVLSGPRLYLRRYALLEQLVADRLRSPSLELPEGAEDALARCGEDADDSQRAAVLRALRSSVSVIAGGPGTGKTTTVALLLRVASSLPAALRTALSAPTGKAAGRLNEAVRAATGEGTTEAPSATTVHRLLGVGRDGIIRGERTIDRDLVVVDEASMVSLPLLAEVLGRVRPDARVVLVGDPDQLASIEVGAVLADVVAAAADTSTGVAVSRLAVAHRFEGTSGVAALAEAVRTGDPAVVDAAFDAHRGQLRRVEPAQRSELVGDVVDHAARLLEVARAGDAAGALEVLGSLGVLCGTRHGDLSTSWWREEIERQLVARGALRSREADYVGRPLLVTRNDPLTGLTNGSIGVIVAAGADARAVFQDGTFALSALSATETVWAMTIHKSQGSEYSEVVVSLPGKESPVLTRELVYTAVTRSRGAVTLVAPPGSLDAALSRRVARSSGLRARLARAAAD